MKEVGSLILVTIAVVVVFGLLLALPTMWLWNGCLVGAIGSVHEIGWLQAWGINTLFSILFKPWEGSKKKD